MTSKKRKRNWIQYRSDSEKQAMRYNVQRRIGSTRHEMMRQICPVPHPVSQDLMARKDAILQRLDGCVYCGHSATTNDHFEPLVVNGLPSGVICTPLDLVPCCSWCNSSKGSRKWTLFMQSLVDKQKITTEEHDRRCAILAKYSSFRQRHEQQWDVEANRVHVDRLNAMVNDCHAFMQKFINESVQAMHGRSAIVVHARETTFDWTDIQTQIQNYKNDGSA